MSKLISTVLIVLAVNCYGAGYDKPITNGQTSLNKNTTHINSKSYYMYVNSISGKISEYNIDPDTGRLKYIKTAMGNIKFSEIINKKLIFDHTGKFAYKINSGENTISIYKVASGNSLIPLSIHPVTITGANPTDITIDLTNKYAYVINNVDNTISMYSIDQHSGALNALTPSVVKTGNWPTGITFDSTGKYIYVTNSLDGTISKYNFDSNTGLLTQPSVGSTFITGMFPTEIKFDPTGKYAYVTNNLDNTISMYRFDPKNGKLDTLTKEAKIGTAIGPFAISFI